MPRYYFHTTNSHGVARDTEGQPLPGLEAARDEAVRSIRELLSEEIRSGQINVSGRVDVTDEDGDAVLTVNYQETFTVVH